MPKFTVGYYQLLKTFQTRRRQDLPFFFCGDYLAGSCVEAAARSGLAAAEEVAKSFPLL